MGAREGSGGVGWGCVGVSSFTCLFLHLSFLSFLPHHFPSSSSSSFPLSYFTILYYTSSPHPPSVHPHHFMLPPHHHHPVHSPSPSPSLPPPSSSITQHITTTRYRHSEEGSIDVTYRYKMLLPDSILWSQQQHNYETLLTSH